MYKLFDVECAKCGHTYAELINVSGNKPPLPSQCPECDSAYTCVLPGGLKHYKAKDPYDYLDKGPPDSKKIFSGPKVSSK